MRHPDADYSDPGAYFLTICTQNRDSLFGNVVQGEMILNQLGNIVWEVWKTLPERYANVSIDVAVVMPDHFHGIVIIHEIDPVGEIHEFPLLRDTRRRMTIPLIVGYLKMNTSKQINQIRNTPGHAVWQRNYFDKILRDDRDYEELSTYILTNPMRWGLDLD